MKKCVGESDGDGAADTNKSVFDLMEFFRCSAQKLDHRVKGNPRLKTLQALLHAVGLRLAVQVNSKQTVGFFN